MGGRREDQAGTARFLGGRSRRQVPCGGGNGFTHPERTHLSRGAAARSVVQRGGRSGVLRFLLPRRCAARRFADRDFNRGAESIAGAETSAAAGTAVRFRIRGVGGAAWRDSTAHSSERSRERAQVGVT